MVIKTAQMGIPILISRSGFTAWGVQLARQIGMTLIGRAKGKRFVALAGAERLRFDADPREVGEERSEEHTSELQSLMRISYAVFCLKKKKHKNSERHIQ